MQSILVILANILDES